LVAGTPEVTALHCENIYIPPLHRIMMMLSKIFFILINLGFLTSNVTIKELWFKKYFQQVKIIIKLISKKAKAQFKLYFYFISLSIKHLK
jgi:hypothetical protein